MGSERRVGFVLCLLLLVALASAGWGAAASRIEKTLVPHMWSVTQEGDELRIGYGSGASFPQVAALHLNSSYLRLVPTADSAWGTSVVLVPCFWSGGVLYQGAPVSYTQEEQGADLLLTLTASVAGLSITETVRFCPPGTDAITATVNVSITGDVALDPRPGEAFKLLMLSSMHISSESWDCAEAYVGETPYSLPTSGWIIAPGDQVTGTTFGLTGGSNAWKTNAPTVEVALDAPTQIAGWVTESADPNDDNVGLWPASSVLVRSYRYTITARTPGAISIRNCYLSDTGGLPGENAPCYLGIDQGRGVAAFQVDVSFDAAAKELVSVSAGALLPAGWSVLSRELDTGLVRVLGYNTSAMALGVGGGPLAQLTFRELTEAAPGISEVGGTNAVLSDHQGIRIEPVVVRAGTNSVLMPLVAEAGPDREIVAGGSTTLEGAASGGFPPYRYLWTPQTGLSDTDIASPLASPTTTTTYQFEVTDRLGHTDTDTVTVTVESPPPSDLSVLINAGVACTQLTAVTLSLQATGAYEMRFRNESAAWSAWEPFALTKSWDLGSTRGIRTVGFQCRSQAGALSEIATDTIAVPYFDDVGCSSSLRPYVEAMVREGITSGCSVSPPRYCPTLPVTRGQMAVFLCRAAGLAPYDNPVPTFTDVAPGTSQYAYIEAVYRAGITAGCSSSPPCYCPAAPVTRGQMAVFLCRAAGIAPYRNPTPTFEDVPPSSSQYGYVEAMYQRGVTTGCSVIPPRYCPTAAVTRGQMAVFICRAFGIIP